MARPSAKGEQEWNKDASSFRTEGVVKRPARSPRQRHAQARGPLGDPERAWLREPRADLGGGAGPPKAEALHGVDAGGAQEQMLLGGLHALGGHLHAEATAEAHHRMHDR